MAYKEPLPTPITVYALSRKAVTTTYTVLTTDELIANTNILTAYTITLPACSAVLPGKVYYFKDEGGTASLGTITIATNNASTEKINGASTYPINTNYGYLRVYNTGLTWIEW